MSSIVDILAERVVGAAELITSLRSKVRSLEQDLMTAHAMSRSPSTQHAPASPDSALIEELERLRTERAVVRESIRGLLREIDRVSW